VYKILAENVTIGRHPQNDVVLEDPTVSGEHARISYDGVAFEIADLGSRGGIRVNARPVTQAEIRDGDRIRLGNSVFVFSVKTKSGAPAATSGGGPPAAQPQMAAAARVRVAIYGVVSLVLAGAILAMLGAKQDGRQLDTERGRVGLRDIGPLGIEQFEPPVHQPTDEQIRQAALHLQRGIIELDSGNLLDAIGQLQLSLQSNPGCEACKAQLEWAHTQLRKRIAYHYEAGDDHYKNLRYRDAVRHWEVVQKLTRPTDRVHAELQKRADLARQKQAELERRAVGLP
jgi:hypothetical protein